MNETTTLVPPSNNASTSFCAAFYREPLPKNIVSFYNTNSLRRSHEDTLRFGHTSEVMDLLLGTSEEGSSYLKGVVATSFVIMSCFLCWGITLLILRCLGYKRVGFFAGYRVKLAKPDRGLLAAEDEQNDDSQNEINNNNNNSERDVMSNADASNVTPHGAKTVVHKNTTDNNDIQTDAAILSGEHDEQEEEEDKAQTMEQWQTAVEHSNAILKRIRVTVLIVGAIIVASAICMVSKGVSSLDGSLYSFQEGMNEAQGLALGGVELIDRFWARQTAFRRSSTTLRESLNTFCPKVRPVICDNIETGENCNYEDLPFATEVQAVLQSTRTNVFLELNDMRNDLLELADDFDSMEEAANNFSWVFWMAAAYALALAALTLVIMYGVVQAWRNQGGCILDCLRNWFVMPVYLVLVFLSWLFSMLFIIFSITTADFCIDSPDARVLAILSKNSDQFSSVVYDFATWIIGGCPDGTAPDRLLTAFDSILKALQVIYNFSESIVEADYSTEDFWDVVCGSERPDTVIALAQTLQGIACVMANSLTDVQVFFSCGNWHPLYEETVYNAICWDSNEGFLWIALTQIIIVVGAMIMLTLRVAFQRDEKEEVSCSCFRRS